MVAGLWVLIILFAIYFFIGYLIPFLKSREPVIKKDCVYCERTGLGDGYIADRNCDPYDIIIPTESNFDYQCNLFKCKIDKNFNCDGCKKYKLK